MPSIVFRFHLKRLTVLMTLALSFGPAAAIAGPFSDVPDEYPYATAIADLKEQNILRGNPDGTATPDRLLNRAELLTLLYRATNRIPRAVYGDCFEDVKEGWFEDVVCDAAHEGFVDGYLDGTFKAEQSVIRVEFFKMLLKVMGFTVPDLSQEDKLSIDFLGNVTHSAWYSPYLHRVLALKMVPEAYFIDNMFEPSLPVKRGEAAEMISRALHTEDIFFQEETENEEAEEEVQREVENERSREAEGERTAGGVLIVPFPIHRSAATSARNTSSFVFDLSEKTTVLLQATHKASSQISCYLYLLSESGFTSEFFVGYEERGSCFIRGALRPGRYQVEVRTVSEGEAFALDIEPSSGDGNDGFVEAVSLRPGFARSGALTSNDYEDLFRFSIERAESRRLTCSSSSKLTFSVFPDESVDLFGEQGPACGEVFFYQPGTYYISVQRTAPSSASQAYTIDLR